jgi:alpha-beta hydrolase superfamily lysophospholipase
MSYINKQSNFKSSLDNKNIFYQSWTKTNSSQVLVFQHGFGEHSDRYKNILDTLKDESISVYALDARGHGRSEGKRGHVDQFQNYIDDLSDLIRIAKEEEKKEKVVLLGHSLGGVIALQYATEGFNQENLSGILIQEEMKNGNEKLSIICPHSNLRLKWNVFLREVLIR